MPLFKHSLVYSRNLTIYAIAFLEREEREKRMMNEGNLSKLLESSGKAHLVLVPLVAQGHMIPMVDIATLLAQRGALVTLFTTPVNSARFKAVFDSVKQSALPVHFAELPFPCAQAGLPDGCENVDLVPSHEYFRTFFETIPMLREPLVEYLRAHRPPPSCIITDMCNPWTMAVAKEFNVPRLIFHGPSCLYILISHLLKKHDIYEQVPDRHAPIVVPDFPYHLEVTTALAPGFFNITPGWEKLRDEVWESEAAADGFVINTFDDLELLHVECFRKEKLGKKVWTIGPLCLRNKDLASKASRGNKASVDPHQVVSWLNCKEPSSVIYVSFGSISRNTTEQLFEIGYGLESSNRSFIWVIKDQEWTPEVGEWLTSEGGAGFKERIGERGFVIRGWSPQVLILSHPAIGGFMTHCGWNSILEAVSEGLPMITWPRFSDQFANERQVVDVLKIGVKVGLRSPASHLHDAKRVELVTRTMIEEVISRLMEEKERRERASELGKKARKAMEEGGSSYSNINDLLDFCTATRTSF